MVGGTAGYMQAQPDIWWGGVVCLIIVSTPGPDFAKVLLGFVKLVTRFGQVGDQVDQVKARARSRSLTI